MRIGKYLAIAFLATQIACKSIPTKTTELKIHNDSTSIDYNDYILDGYVNVEINKEEGIYVDIKSVFVKSKKGIFGRNKELTHELSIFYDWDPEKRLKENNYVKFIVDGKGNLIFRQLKDKKDHGPIYFNKVKEDPVMERNNEIIRKNYEYFLRKTALEKIILLRENSPDYLETDSIYSPPIDSLYKNNFKNNP